MAGCLSGHQYADVPLVHQRAHLRDGRSLAWDESARQAGLPGQGCR